MMVVHKRNGADCLLILIPFIAHQIRPNQITDRFRPARITPPSDMPVEFFQQVSIQRHSEPNQFIHIASLT
jgi:hypothetical protein